MVGVFTCRFCTTEIPRWGSAGNTCSWRKWVVGFNFRQCVIDGNERLNDFRKCVVDGNERFSDFSQCVIDGNERLNNFRQCVIDGNERFNHFRHFSFFKRSKQFHNYCVLFDFYIIGISISFPFAKSSFSSNKMKVIICKKILR